MATASLILAFIAMLAFFILPVGLLKPSWLRHQSRGKVLKSMLFAFLVFISASISYGAFEPERPTDVIEAELDEAKTKIYQLEQQASKRNEQTDELGEARAEILSLKNSLEKAESERDDLKKEIAKLQDESAKEEKSDTQGDEELARLKKENEDLQKQISKANTTIATLKAQPTSETQSTSTPKATTQKLVADQNDTNDPTCKLKGKVVKVPDGDSITVLDSNNKQHRVRLSGIDSPERGQPFVKTAGKFLRKMVAGKTVCVDWYRLDRYKRKLGVVRLNDEDVGLKVVQAGLAWHFKKFQKEQTPADRKLYAAAHKKARAEFKGLWSQPDPIEPDAWRAGTRPKKVTQAQKETVNRQKQLVQKNTSGFSCGGKRYCKHMGSCAEACFHLNQCGLTRLDRDKDGIPCEAFCGGC